MVVNGKLYSHAYALERSSLFQRNNPILTEYMFGSYMTACNGLYQHRKINRCLTSKVFSAMCEIVRWNSVPSTTVLKSPMTSGYLAIPILYFKVNVI